MKKKYFAAGAAVAVIAVAGMVFALNRPKNDMPESKTTEADNGTVTETATEGTTLEPVTEEYIIGLSDEKLTDEVRAQLEAINAKLDSYMANKKSKNSFISDYGFLYNDTLGRQITISDLVNEGVIEASDEVTKYTDIVYMRASDVAAFAPNIDKSDERLQVFTVYNNEEGYFISNDFYSEGAMLKKEDYEKLVLSYSYIHGNVRSPKKGDADYEAIMSAIRFDGEYDVKHIACDNMYAVVVMGGLEDTKILKEYVLTNDGTAWEIAIEDLEQSEDPRYDVNMKFPKMELGLLPVYTIAKYGQLQNDFTKYYDPLVELGMIGKDDTPATYDCGTSGFAYMEFGDKHLLGHVNENNELAFVSVDSTEQAIAYMLQYDPEPPAFILNFHN